MKKTLGAALTVLMLSALAIPAIAGTSEIYLSDLTPLYENNVHGCLQLDKVYWQPDIVIDGVVYSKGLGMHSPALDEVPNTACQYFAERTYLPGRGTAAWKLNGAYKTFSSRIALAEQNGEETSVPTDGTIFRIYLDDVLIYSSDVVYFTTPPIDISLDVSNGNVLVLEVDSNGSNWGDHNVWANARLLPKQLDVAIDIKPGNFPNSINLKNNGNVPVAILGGSGFDVTTIDPSSVVFQGARPLHLTGTSEDINSDGILDKVFHFATQDLILQSGDTTGCLTGQTVSGRSFKGCDSVRIVNN